MSLSDTSIKNPVFAWMLLGGIVVFGLVAFFRLGVSQLPDVDFPVLTITTTWQNAAPEVIEQELMSRANELLKGDGRGLQDFKGSVPGDVRKALRRDLGHGQHLRKTGRDHPPGIDQDHRVRVG